MVACGSSASLAWDEAMTASPGSTARPSAGLSTIHVPLNPNTFLTSSEVSDCVSTHMALPAVLHAERRWKGKSVEGQISSRINADSQLSVADGTVDHRSDSSPL